MFGARLVAVIVVVVLDLGHVLALLALAVGSYCRTAGRRFWWVVGWGVEEGKTSVVMMSSDDFK